MPATSRTGWCRFPGSEDSALPLLRAASIPSRLAPNPAIPSRAPSTRPTKKPGAQANPPPEPAPAPAMATRCSHLRANPVSHGCLGMCSANRFAKKSDALMPKLRFKGKGSFAQMPPPDIVRIPKSSRAPARKAFAVKTRPTAPNP